MKIGQHEKRSLLGLGSDRTIKQDMNMETDSHTAGSDGVNLQAFYLFPPFSF